jgi:peptidoglycan/LPS O-acetylase OafA/YrhL
MSEIAARAPVAEANGRPSNRIPSLDGLRGVASLVVVTFHIALNDAVVGARPYRRDQTSGVGWLGAMMTFTPLHLLWAGEQAVAVFFVLSGFVLALPFARRGTHPGRGTFWIRFYRSRAVRLYLPAVASLVLAYGLALVVTYPGDTGLSPWLKSHSAPARLIDLVVGSTLMSYNQLNISLWSLRWEVLFSLALPIFLALAVWRVMPSWVKATAMLGCLTSWSVISGSPYFNSSTLLIFGFGVLMAYESDRLGVLAARLSAQAWIGILVTACLLLSLQWMVLPFGVQPGSVFGDLWMTYTAAGATLLVFTAAFCGPVRRLLERRPIQLLGLLSFSLYLVQEPVTIRFALATHASLPLWLALPIELTLALVVAVLFYRAVERPAHRLARRVGAVPVGRHSVPAIDRTGPVSAPRVGSP